MGGRFPAYAPPVVNEPEGKRDGRRFQPVVGLVAAVTDQAGEACIAEAHRDTAWVGTAFGPAVLDEYFEVGHLSEPVTEPTRVAGGLFCIRALFFGPSRKAVEHGAGRWPRSGESGSRGTPQWRGSSRGLRRSSRRRPPSG